MYKKLKILFVCHRFSSFIQKDLDLLRKHFDVQVAHYTGIVTILKLFKGVIWADLTFSWFAYKHTFLSVLFSKISRKKSIVVIGGGEVANIPEIDYGLMGSLKYAWMVKFILKNANKLVAVSKFNKKEILKYINPENIELVYNGTDYNEFKPKGKKEEVVLTISFINKNNLKRKGLETFVLTAKYMPFTKFVIVGPDVDGSIKELKKIAPDNTEFVGFKKGKELLNYLQKAKVYCQLSYYESFGMGLAEAMLCECVPVVTDKGALPEVAGNTGFYVQYGDPKATAEAIKEALKSDKGKEARERIKNMFPIEKRESKLVNIIETISKNN